MDRNAVVLYLREVRDLEFARKRIVDLYHAKERKFQKRKQYLTISRVDKPVPANYECKIEIPWGRIIGGCFIICGSFLVPFCFFVAIYQWYKAIKQIHEERKLSKQVASEYREHLAKYEAEIARIEGSREEYVALVDNWNQGAEYLNGEFRTVQSLLNDYYSMNILPEVYRNIQSVYYLHKYMSTSQESLSNAFLHEHMENGIQRILERLDQIVEQNAEIIFHQRIIETQNRELIDVNYAMLSELEELNHTSQKNSKKIDETNCYLRTNNYFMLASYLSDKQHSILY